jgi:signal-transduction protein with cAMP-binding, CBS, and nucleotidyltransferase domain
MYQDIIKNVPLFAELEVAEIIFIVKNLETDIYLPDDYIIHDEEVGNEMYFLIDGVAKIVLKSQENSDIFIKKGEYFGEIALIIDSKRTADVISVDFTICEKFSRERYEKLNLEFPEI